MLRDARVCLVCPAAAAQAVVDVEPRCRCAGRRVTESCSPLVQSKGFNEIAATLEFLTEILGGVVVDREQTKCRRCCRRSGRSPLLWI